MSTAESTQGRSKPARSTRKASRPLKMGGAAAEGHVCPVAGCDKVCKTAAGLGSHQRQTHPAAVAPVSPAAALEAALVGVSMSAAQTVLAATARELAEALEECDPTDKAKTAKEFRSIVAELLAVHGPPAPGAGGNWTEDDD